LRPKRRPHSVCNRTPRYLLSTCDHHHRAPSTHKHNIPLPSELLPKAPYLSLQGLQAFNILSRMRSQDISVALALVLSLATLVNGVRMGNSPQLGVEETLNVPDMIHSRQPNIGAFGRSLLFGSSTGGGVRVQEINGKVPAAPSARKRINGAAPTEEKNGAAHRHLMAVAR